MNIEDGTGNHEKVRISDARAERGVSNNEILPEAVYKELFRDVIFTI